MSEATIGTDVAPSPRRASMATVVIASAAGTSFEWYDFFVFGALTPIIAKNFFSGLSSTAGLLAALALFGVAYFFRPLGALIFGRLGDRTGRKGTFLITMSMMGGATVAIGLLPTFPMVGALAPLLLVLMRIVQGTALGGMYGGAVIYVAEHAAPKRRATLTSAVQSSAAFGLIGALLVILAVRGAVGDARFADSGWAGGWRAPFLFSAGLLAMSLWMRLKLSESPVFAALEQEGARAKAPYAEAFGRWPNLKLVLSAFVGIMSAQGAAWYLVFFFAEQVFLERFMKVAPQTGEQLLILITMASAPLYMFFGWLSDKVGRKWVMWGGMTLALIAYFPAFHLMAGLSNPGLVAAQQRTPVTVVADPARCSLQFDLLGTAHYVTACDLAKSALANAGVSYANETAPAGPQAVIRVGDTTVASRDGTGLSPTALAAAKSDVQTRVRAALTAAGYPAKADPSRLKFWGLFSVLMVFVVACTALYGPIATALVELFPANIRYTALSLPYHVGTGWIGGFVPVTSFAIVTATGDIYAGLWYAFIFTALSVFTLPFLIPETRGRSIA
ncbi:MAG TPA: MFS transporter [Caulobacteraceae bacterium]|nr:MFS transporter [Caulobacteraceae bacterium]